MVCAAFFARHRPGLHQREACLHEDDQEARQQNPDEVEREVVARRRARNGIDAGRDLLRCHLLRVELGVAGHRRGRRASTETRPSCRVRRRLRAPSGREQAAPRGSSRRASVATSETRSSPTRPSSARASDLLDLSDCAGGLRFRSCFKKASLTHDYLWAGLAAALFPLGLGVGLISRGHGQQRAPGPL